MLGELENLRGTSAAHPVANSQSFHARVGYRVNTGKYTPCRAWLILEKASIGPALLGVYFPVLPQ